MPKKFNVYMKKFVDITAYTLILEIVITGKCRKERMRNEIDLQRYDSC